MLKLIKPRNTKKKLASNGSVCYQFDKDLGFWGIPNINIEVVNEYNKSETLKIKHNSHGNRDEENCHSSNQDNILCLGGSHTWGGGVPQDSRYTEHLAAMTNHKVFNMGHCSLGLDQICLAIIQKSITYQPKIIIVEQYPWALHRILNNYVNGYIRPHFSINAKGELSLEKVPLMANNKTMRKIIGSYFAYRKEFFEFKSGLNIKVNYDAALDPIFLAWKSRHYDQMYQLVDKILGVIAGYCMQKNIKIIFCLGAIVQQFWQDPKSSLINYLLPRDRLIALLKKNDIPFIDMTNSMISNHTETEPVIFTDGHINRKGHYIFANTLHAGLVERGWI